MSHKICRNQDGLPGQGIFADCLRAYNLRGDWMQRENMTHSQCCVQAACSSFHRPWLHVHGAVVTAVGKNDTDGNVSGHTHSPDGLQVAHHRARASVSCLKAPKWFKMLFLNRPLQGRKFFKKLLRCCNWYFGSHVRKIYAFEFFPPHPFTSNAFLHWEIQGITPEMDIYKTVSQNLKSFESHWINFFLKHRAQQPSSNF